MRREAGGGWTSPALFNLYINELIVALSSQHVGCHIDDICVNNFSYADDMVLLSASISGVRTLLRTCEVYAERHGLVYNVKKSQYLIFSAGQKQLLDGPEIKLNGVALERVNEFRYLGHILVPSLNDDADIERERRALSVRANMIAHRFSRCSEGVKVTLFRAYCTTFYTCSLWASYSMKSYRTFRIQYNNAFRALMGLPRYCSASGMFASARTDCFFATMRRRAASLVHRVRASPNKVLAMIAARVDSVYINHCSDLQMVNNKK